MKLVLTLCYYLDYQNFKTRFLLNLSKEWIHDLLEIEVKNYNNVKLIASNLAIDNISRSSDELSHLSKTVMKTGPGALEEPFFIKVNNGKVVSVLEAFAEKIRLCEQHGIIDLERASINRKYKSLAILELNKYFELQILVLLQKRGLEKFPSSLFYNFTQNLSHYYYDNTREFWENMDLSFFETLVDSKDEMELLTLKEAMLRKENVKSIIYIGDNYVKINTLLKGIQDKEALLDFLKGCPLNTSIEYVDRSDGKTSNPFLAIGLPNFSDNPFEDEALDRHIFMFQLIEIHHQLCSDLESVYDYDI